METEIKREERPKFLAWENSVGNYPPSTPLSQVSNIL